MEVYFLKKLILHRSEIRGRNESQNIEGYSEQNCRKSLLIPPLHLPAHFFETPAQFKVHLRPIIILLKPKQVSLLRPSSSLLDLQSKLPRETHEPHAQPSFPASLVHQSTPCPCTRGSSNTSTSQHASGISEDKPSKPMKPTDTSIVRTFTSCSNRLLFELCHQFVKSLFLPSPLLSASLEPCPC